jgi:hypothetical protein
MTASGIKKQTMASAGTVYLAEFEVSGLMAMALGKE